MAKIYVNGDAQEVSLPLNVSELIQQQNVLQPEMVSVQVNEEFGEPVSTSETTTLFLLDGVEAPEGEEDVYLITYCSRART